MAEDQNEAIQAEETERPEWLPSNFESPEDLAKSYKEIQALSSRLGSEKSEAEKRAAELEARLTSLEAASQQPNEDQTEWLQEALDTRPLETIAWLTQQAAAQAVQQHLAQQPQANNHEVVAYAADQALGQKFDDWDVYKGKIAEAVQSDPGLMADVNENTPLAGVQRALERAYKFVKADDVLSHGGALAQQAEAARAAKNAAMTLSGSSGRPDAESGADAAKAILEAAKHGNYADFRG